MATASLHKKRCGKLTVYRKLSFTNKRGTLWLCGCDCGGQKVVSTGNLNSRLVKSCGCNAHPKGRDNIRSMLVKVFCAAPGCAGFKDVKPYKAKTRTNHFCNNECYSVWQRENRKGENHAHWKGGYSKISCDWCGKDVLVRKWELKKRKNIFCKPGSDGVRNCFYKWRSANLKGSNNYRWQGGKVDVPCAYCGKTKPVWKCLSEREGRVFFCTDTDCRSKWQSENFSGENNGNWKGGISTEPYCTIWNNNGFRDEILERDNNRCSNPDCWNTAERLCLHHIDYDKKNCYPDNLITLCVSCNSRANIDRDWHTAWYGALMQRSGKSINNHLNI